MTAMPDFSISRPLPGARHVVGSLGLGVQSSTMALMAKHGLISPEPERYYFGDPKAEAFGIYEQLRFLRSANVGLPPIETVSAGDLKADVLNAAGGWQGAGADDDRALLRKALRIATPPFFTRGPRTIAKSVYVQEMPLFGLPAERCELIVERHTDRETFGILRRQCTHAYKIEPITAAIRLLLGLKPRQRGPGEPVVELWIGLTVDELERVAGSHTRFIHHRQPLIELRMSRGDCVQWLLRNGYPVPPKSRCFFCPFQTDELWAEMKADHPDLFAMACELDRAIRHGLPGTNTLLYLHPSRKPLEEVDFSNPDRLWTNDGMRNECMGACGT